MTQLLSPEYWNERYLHNDFAWDAGVVTPPLQTYFDQLANKDLKILIPGAGNAHEAEYLVNSGFTNVYVCDFALEPLKNLKKRCPAFKSENLLFIDFFKLEMQYDLIIEQTFFCALNPSLRKNYFTKMNALLKPNGKLVGVLFNDKLNTDQPPFGGTKEEYLSYIGADFKIKTLERCYNSIKPRKDRELFIILEHRNL